MYAMMLALTIVMAAGLALNLLFLMGVLSVRRSRRRFANSAAVSVCGSTRPLAVQAGPESVSAPGGPPGESPGATDETPVTPADVTTSASTPGVTILKPLKGTDPGLEANLRSFFQLDYPEYQLLFGVASADDPAVAVVRRMLAEFPDADAALIIDGRAVGHNPKVNNLANLGRFARHEMLLISDSNVLVAPSYLRDMVCRIAQPGVGLVTSAFVARMCSRPSLASREARTPGSLSCSSKPVQPPALPAHGGSGIGARLEALQLHTFVVGGMAALNRLLRQPVAVGKSMMLRRETLDAIGGWRELGRYLAEDQVCAVLVARLGLKVAVAHNTIDNVLGPMTIRAFIARHMRWGMMRRHLAPGAFAVEPLFNPLLTGIAAIALLPWPAGVLLAAGVFAAKVALEAGAERALGHRRSLLEYLWLAPLKEVFVLTAWALALARNTVVWRGRSYRIGRGTLVTPVEAEDAPRIAPVLPPGRALVSNRAQPIRAPGEMPLPLALTAFGIERME